MLGNACVLCEQIEFTTRIPTQILSLISLLVTSIRIKVGLHSVLMGPLETE